jgi:hypothetical protein
MIRDTLIEACCPRCWLDAVCGAVFLGCLFFVGIGIGG